MRVQSHALPLSEAERSGLLPDRIRDADAAEVVRERGAPHERHRGGREAQPPGGGLGEVGDARRVLAKPRRLEVGERARSPRMRRRPVSPSIQICGAGSISSACCPHARLIELGEDVGEVARSELGEPRLVRRARSTLDDGACLLGAGGGLRNTETSRATCTSRIGSGNLVAARDARESQPVPTLEHVFERRLDAAN